MDIIENKPAVAKSLGMFVHWGLYTLGGFHEQEIYRHLVPRDEYARYMFDFNPASFDPDRFIDIAKSAGMEYIVITAKHIDGFCMFDSKYTDFKVTNTPFGRDILALLAEACERRGFGLGVYYSVADMNSPVYPNHGRSYEYPYPQPGDHPNLEKYIEYVKNQVRELCENYGRLVTFFWDANVIGHVDESVNEMIRRLQPGILINDRGFDTGDYGTPEREFQKKQLDAQKTLDRYTIGINSTGMFSWSYKPDESYYSEKFLISSIDRILALGGGYQLNVGPMPDGNICAHDAAIFEHIGEWYERVRESFDGCTPVPDKIKNENMLVTAKGDSLYLHLLADPIGDSIMLEGLTKLPRRAVLLNTGDELICRRGMNVRTWSEPMEFVRVYGLPLDKLYPTVGVIRLDF